MGTINQYSKMNLSIDENDKGELCIWDEINEKHVQCIATITDNNYDIGQLFKAAPKLLEALQFIANCSEDITKIPLTKSDAKGFVKIAQKVIQEATQ